MLFFLFVLLTVLGGVTAVGLAASERRRVLGRGGSPPRALPGGSDKLLERTIRDLRVGDVLTIDGRDFLCEGAVAYDEDGHRWSAGRVVDGSDTRWLVVGIERAGAMTIRMLTVDEATRLTGYPPEALVIGDVKYVLDKRGTATCKLQGDVGGLGGLQRDRPAANVERCRWWLYDGTSDASAIVEQWGSDYRVLRGTKVSGESIELIVGS